jgi:hypothetical protein
MHIVKVHGATATVSFAPTWHPLGLGVSATVVDGATYEARQEPDGRWRITGPDTTKPQMLPCLPAHIAVVMPVARALDGPPCPCGCTTRVRATLAQT